LKSMNNGEHGEVEETLKVNNMSKVYDADYFYNTTGNGHGYEFHQNPRLAKGSKTIIEENMVVTIEPGIYVPNVGGCRIEDDIIVTNEGNIRLTHSKKELIIL